MLDVERVRYGLRAGAARRRRSAYATRQRGWSLLSLGMALALGVAASAAADDAFRDLLETPAEMVAAPEQTVLMDVVYAGERLVAVGRRGHVVLSDDGGGSWRQAQVPASVDLVAVNFPTERHGWAVGHDGVVLHSADAGETWTRQFDGWQALERMKEYYASAAAEEIDEGTLSAIARELEYFAEEAPARPFLDVWFKNEREGFIVGAYNLIFHTTDSGRTWTPWSHRTDNPLALHLDSIAGSENGIFIVGEQGLVLKFDEESGRFSQVEFPYLGSLFGVQVGRDFVVVHGMRGTAYVSAIDELNWQAIRLPTDAHITGSTLLDDGRLVLVTHRGEVLLGSPTQALRPLQVPQPMSYTEAAASSDRIVLVGFQGVRQASLTGQELQQEVSHVGK